MDLPQGTIKCGENFSLKSSTAKVKKLQNLASCLFTGSGSGAGGAGADYKLDVYHCQA